VKISIFTRHKAEQLHNKAQRLSSSGNDSEALALYQEALNLDPLRPSTLYNMGLIYKYRGDWEKSLELNQKAYELDSSDEASRWNIAIAATALRRWRVARKAWKDNGYSIDESDDPVDLNCGSTPVRLNADEDGEVVWAQRIDPVRAVIQSIPLPASGFRFGDVVLNDGAAVGYRKVKDREYPVFNVLELFEQSSSTTFVVEVIAADASQIEALHAECDKAGIEMEDWTASVRSICRKCSEGVPHDHHDEGKSSEWQTHRRIGMSAESVDDVTQLLSWCSESRIVEVKSFDLALDAR